MDEITQALDSETAWEVALVDIGGFGPAIWPLCEHMHQRDIPLLIISPRPDRRLQQAGLSAGARGVLTKPLAINDLLNAIRMLRNEL